MREHVWLAGRYVDNVLMGVLREEWRRSAAGAS
jgi:RimJ/RimL family protein N-acetyltransferase